MVGTHTVALLVARHVTLILWRIFFLLRGPFLPIHFSEDLTDASTGDWKKTD